jgi:transmembrane sensor
LIPLTDATAAKRLLRPARARIPRPFRLVLRRGAADAPAVRINDVTPAQVERALAWHGLRLEFLEMPLRDVVAEFNRSNRRKLSVRDRATAAIVVGGNFRADNSDAFVRLLESSFGVTARSEGDEIVLGLAR